MAKKEAPLEALAQYLPDNTLSQVLLYLKQYRVHLTITRDRKSVLGDYRHRTFDANHRISVNGSLNRYAFLITLLHELAHLLTFEQHGNRVAAHGREWKNVYGQLLREFLLNEIFPTDIANALKQSLHNPAASSCAEDDLLRVLRNYDPPKRGLRLVEEIGEGKQFKTSDNRIFERGERLRKRYRCVEVATGRVYLFSPVYEVAEV